MYFSIHHSDYVYLYICILLLVLFYLLIFNLFSNSPTLNNSSFLYKFWSIILFLVPLVRLSSTISQLSAIENIFFSVPLPQLDGATDFNYSQTSSFPTTKMFILNITNSSSDTPSPEHKSSFCGALKSTTTYTPTKLIVDREIQCYIKLKLKTPPPIKDMATDTDSEIWDRTCKNRIIKTIQSQPPFTWTNPQFNTLFLALFESNSEHINSCIPRGKYLLRKGQTPTCLHPSIPTFYSTSFFAVFDQFGRFFHECNPSCKTDCPLWNSHINLTIANLWLSLQSDIATVRNYYTPWISDSDYFSLKPSVTEAFIVPADKPKFIDPLLDLTKIKIIKPTYDLKIHCHDSLLPPSSPLKFLFPSKP